MKILVMPKPIEGVSREEMLQHAAAEIQAVWDLGGGRSEQLLHFGNVGLDPLQVFVRAARIGLVQEPMQPPKFVGDFGQDILLPEAWRFPKQIGRAGKTFRQGHLSFVKAG